MTIDKKDFIDEERGFDEVNFHLSLFGRYYDNAIIQDGKDLEAGKALVCPHSQGVCDFEYCQSFNQSSGCKYLWACWGSEKCLSKE